MKTLIVGILSMVLAIMMAAQAPSDVVQSLVDTENAFAAMAGQKGIKASFLAYMAKDAVVFSPEPTDAHKKYEVKDDDPGLLYWVPEFVQISGAGDMGWTSGPWEYRAHKTDEKPLVTGHFVTVWKKQTDGTWKWVLDAGVPNPLDKAIKPLPFHEKKTPFEGKSQDSSELKKARNAFQTMENSFALVHLAPEPSNSNKPESAIAGKSWGDFFNILTEDSLVYRKGLSPLRGGQTALGRENGIVFFYSTGGGIPSEGFGLSSNGDLAYSYGSGAFIPNGASGFLDEKSESKFSFLHIWERQKDGSWKIVVDLTNPIPPKK